MPLFSVITISQGLSEALVNLTNFCVIPEDELGVKLPEQNKPVLALLIHVQQPLIPKYRRKALLIRDNPRFVLPYLEIT